MLKAIIKEKKKHEHLSKVEFSINNTVNRSTGFSPSMLLFGICQKGVPCDKVKLLKGNSGTNIKQYKKNQDYNKQNYDKRHKTPNIYNIGDYVMIKHVNTISGINHKLLPSIADLMKSGKYCKTI